LQPDDRFTAAEQRRMRMGRRLIWLALLYATAIALAAAAFFLVEGPGPH
jgi:hypothetical protein